MADPNQVLEPEDKGGESVAKVRFSREGGLEHLVRELYLGNKFVLSFPVDIRLNEDDKELCFTFSTNVGIEPHPGLHFSVAFDLPVTLPKKSIVGAFDDVESTVLVSATPPVSNKDLLRQEILSAGGDPDTIITPDMTDEKAKEVLDALKA